GVRALRGRAALGEGSPRAATVRRSRNDRAGRDVGRDARGPRIVSSADGAAAVPRVMVLGHLADVGSVGLDDEGVGVIVVVAVLRRLILEAEPEELALGAGEVRRQGGDELPRGDG